jgi:hypothetical protein
VVAHRPFEHRIWHRTRIQIAKDPGQETRHVSRFAAEIRVALPGSYLAGYPGNLLEIVVVGSDQRLGATFKGLSFLYFGFILSSSCLI